ncbi:translocation/assembly module TamB domain-containing protein [Pseudoalteromonas sp. MTN2-4]|uniref:translocation/assembly module TamB domain-containing protein n=1 Tax=Pseudoalteromonas sp. MTN2-4 TaxID=3056555 RepID=UPI0036F405B7
MRLHPITKRILNIGLGTLVFLFCLVFTSVGHQSLLWVLNKSVDGLNIKLEQGRLLAGERLDITWRSEGLNLSLSNFRPQLNWFTCATVCVEITADIIDVKLANSPTDKAIEEIAVETKTEQSEELETGFALPLNVAIAKLNVANIKFQQGDLNVQISDIKSSAQLIDAAARLHETSIKRIHIIDKREKEQESQELTELAALPVIVLPDGLDVRVSQLALGSFEYETPTGSQHIKRFNIAAKITSQQLEWQNLYLEYQQFVLRSFGELRAEAIKQPLVSIKSITTLTTEEELVWLHLSGKFSDLNIDLKAEGQHQVALLGNLNLNQTNWPFDVSAQVSNLPFSYEIRGQDYNALLEQARVELKGNADNYQLKLDIMAKQKELTELSAKVSGKGSLTAISELAGRLNASEGSANLTGKLSWAEGVDAQLRLVMDALPLFFIDQQSVLNGSMSVLAKQKTEGWQIDIPDVDVDGKLSELPLALDASFRLNEQLFGQVDKLKMQLGSSNLQLSGSLQQELDLSGRFAIAHNNFSQKAKALLPFDVDAQGELQIRGDHHQPKISFNSVISKFENNDISLKGGKLDASVDFANNWHTETLLSIELLAVPEHQLNHIELRFTGDQTSHRAQLSSLGDVHAELDILGGLNAQIWQGEIASGRIIYKQFETSLKHHSKLQYASALQWQTGKICGELNQSPWCLQGEQKGKQGQFYINIQDFGLASLQAYLPEQLKLDGKTSINSALSWQDKKLNAVNAKATLQNVAVALSEANSKADSDVQSEPIVPIEQLEINFSGDSQAILGRWQLASSLLGDVSGEVTAQVQDNQLHSPTAKVELHALALKPIGELANRFLPQPINLDGQLSSKLALSGDIKHPNVIGEINLTSFGIQQAALPVSFIDSSLKLGLNGQTASLNGVLNTNEKGVLNLDGKLDWQQQLSAEAVVSGEEIRVSPQQGMSFSISPGLSLKFKDTHLSLTGHVDIPQGRIKISQLPEQVTTVSDDQVIVDAQVQEQESLPFTYTLDLDVALKDDFRVYAFGLDSYVFGQISLDKTPDTPLLASGEFGLREGVYQALGQDLLIQQGQIGFSGPLSRPYLNVKAIRNPEATADDVIAGIELTGSASNPSLNIFSQPAMDQAHALSYLLNGQPLDKSENNNNALLSQMLLAQSINFSESFINKAGKKIGIEDVSVSAKGSGDDTQVELSGYITPSVQVSYRVGVFEAMNEIAIRYRVFTKLYIEATSGLYDSIDLLYQFDWDPE